MFFYPELSLTYRMKTSEITGKGLNYENIPPVLTEEEYSPRALFLNQNEEFKVQTDKAHVFLVYNKSDSSTPWQILKNSTSFLLRAEQDGEALFIFPETLTLILDLHLNGTTKSIRTTFDATLIEVIATLFKSSTPTTIIKNLTAKIKMILEGYFISETQKFEEITLDSQFSISNEMLDKIEMKLSLYGLKLLAIEEAPVEEQESILLVDFYGETPEEREEIKPIQFIPEEKMVNHEPELTQEIENEKKTPTEKLHTVPKEISKEDSTKVEESYELPSAPKSESMEAVMLSDGKNEDLHLEVPTAGGEQSLFEEEIVDQPPPPVPEPSQVKKKTQAPKPKVSRRMRGGTVKETEEIPSIEGLDSSETLNEELFPERLMEAGSPLTSIKNISCTWYNQMIVNKTYPILLKISDREQDKKRKMSSFISGEQITQEHLSVKFDPDLDIQIRAEFPGCLVTPLDRTFSPKEKDVMLRFYVTPLVKGKVDASITFIQNGKTVDSIPLNGKVGDHRVAKIISSVGVLVSVLPSFFAFLFGVTVQEFLSKRVGSDFSVIWNIGTIFGGLFLILLGLILYRMEYEKSKRKTYFEN